ncbi:MAG: hypothetical protein J7M26_01830, partial [Armatimonadetes bacterium]|nr:hypothetical protein [Armatimonadota bacterium]
MKAYTRIKQVALVAMVVAAFVLGIMAGRSVTLVSSDSAMKMADLMPQTVKFQKALDVASPTDLRPLATFWEVREKIKRNFVYPIKDDSKLT